MATKLTPKRAAKAREAAVVNAGAQQPAERALCCAICEKEYTNRKMSISADPNEKVPVCTDCLGKALAMEKANATKDTENEEEGASEPSGEDSGASEEKSEEV
ncbi:MAG: hypothetical protein D4S01_06785 [Dehalococcoidia bacterium]|nr:MAG: hypothetical protein D4S01_06785 [Dehalococcoidia bacterium]